MDYPTLVAEIAQIEAERANAYESLRGTLEGLSDDALETLRSKAVERSAEGGPFFTAIMEVNAEVEGRRVRKVRPAQ